MSFRENLLRLRSEHNMTQEQLASLLGVSRQSVAKWEADRSYPEMDKLIKMTGIFGCTLDELVMGPVGHDAHDDRPGQDEALGLEDTVTSDSADCVCAPALGCESATATPSTPATDTYGYDAHMRSFAKRMAWGVACIIAGVAGLLFVEAALIAMGHSDDSPYVLVALFAGIAIGLSLIIPASMGHSSFMREHPVVRDFYTIEQKREAGQKLAFGIAGGVALIFLGIVLAEPGNADGTALVYDISRIFSSGAAYLIASSVGAGLLLTCIAAAVWCFIYFGIMYSRVHVREYNGNSLDGLVDAYGKTHSGVEALLAGLSPEERRLLFDAEGIDGADSEQVRAFFNTRKRKGNLLGGICSIIMILATIVGLCLLFGIPVYSPVFWMAWVVGGLCCAIAGVIVGAFVK